MPVSRHGLAGAVVGNRLHMVSGDVQSARLFLMRGAEAQNARAALLVGNTYDPAPLRQLGASGLADVAQARMWYQRAKEWGEPDAGTPVLITEQQVLFNTTAAAPLPPVTPARGRTRGRAARARNRPCCSRDCGRSDGPLCSAARGRVVTAHRPSARP